MSGSRISMNVRGRVGGLIAPLIVALVVVPASAARNDRADALAGLDGSLVVAAQRLAALETPPNLGPGARMVFMGDSVGGNVASGLVPEASRRGAVIARETASGCWPIAGSPVTAAGSPLPWAPDCLAYRPTWLATVAATPASAVLWLSTFDAARRLIDGVIVDPATPEGRQRIAELVIETANIVAPPGSGRRVVFFLPASHAPSDLHPVPDPESAIDIQRHRAILHIIVAADPARFSIMNLGRFLCPHGAPCPAQPVIGVTPRGRDGGHLTPEGTAWLAPQVLDALGVT